MNETKSTVKTVLAFVLVLVLIAGGLFGIDVPYDGEDIKNMATDAPATDNQAETSDVTPDDTADEVTSVPVEDDETTVEGDQTDVSQDSTPTDASTENVDNSEGDTVAVTPEDDRTNATE